MKEQIRVYLDSDIIEFLIENKKSKNISDFLNNILKSYKELKNVKSIEIQQILNSYQENQ